MTYDEFDEHLKNLPHVQSVEWIQGVIVIRVDFSAHEARHNGELFPPLSDAVGRAFSSLRETHPGKSTHELYAGLTYRDRDGVDFV